MWRARTATGPSTDFSPKFIACSGRAAGFAFADFVSERHGAHARLLATLRQAPLRLVHVEEITANVVAALAQDEARKRTLLDRWVKGWFRSFAQGAYAMEGSAMQRELAARRTVYLVAVLEKAPAAADTR